MLFYFSLDRAHVIHATYIQTEVEYNLTWAPHNSKPAASGC